MEGIRLSLDVEIQHFSRIQLRWDGQPVKDPAALRSKAAKQRRFVMSNTNGSSNTTTSNSTMKIVVPATEVRYAWRSLADLPFSEAELLEIVQRYCDHAQHQKNYHKSRNLKLKLEASKAKALEARLLQFAKAAGMTLAQYLEVEEENAAASETTGK
jgi:hypothetical protein